MWRRKHAGLVSAIYICGSSGEPMQQVQQIEAVRQRGIKGDRYYYNNGFWKATDSCQITLIQSEDIHAISRKHNLNLSNGEHRRNIVTKGIDLSALQGRRFIIGEAELEYNGPRPPCSYLETLTQKGMIRGLYKHSGICAKVIISGIIYIGDAIKAV